MSNTENLSAALMSLLAIRTAIRADFYDNVYKDGTDESYVSDLLERLGGWENTSHTNIAILARNPGNETIQFSYKIRKNVPEDIRKLRSEMKADLAYIKDKWGINAPAYAGAAIVTPDGVTRSETIKIKDSYVDSILEQLGVKPKPVENTIVRIAPDMKYCPLWTDIYPNNQESICGAWQKLNNALEEEYRIAKEDPAAKNRVLMNRYAIFTETEGSLAQTADETWVKPMTWKSATPLEHAWSIMATAGFTLTGDKYPTWQWNKPEKDSRESHPMLTVGLDNEQNILAITDDRLSLNNLADAIKEYCSPRMDRMQPLHVTYGQYDTADAQTYKRIWATDFPTVNTTIDTLIKKIMGAAGIRESGGSWAMKHENEKPECLLSILSKCCAATVKIGDIASIADLMDDIVNWHRHFIEQHASGAKNGRYGYVEPAMHFGFSVFDGHTDAALKPLCNWDCDVVLKSRTAEEILQEVEKKAGFGKDYSEWHIPEDICFIKWN